MGTYMRKAILLLVVVVAVSSVAYAEVRKDYYESGQLRWEGNFKDGKREGIAKSYYESGQLWKEANLKNGKQHGLVREYYQNGTIKYIDTYEYGTMISQKKYDEDGNLESEQDYPTE